MPKIALDERIIDVSEKTTKEIGAIIETLRSKYAHAIIIEKGNEITQQFARNTDIILDPINGPYSWDIIDEFREDIMFFIDFILDKSNFSNSGKRELESYFFSKINENEAQGKQKTNSLENVICNLRDLNSELREDCIRQFGYLKLLINNHQKTSIARYTQGPGNILMFVPCLRNPALIRIANMIKVLAEDNDIYVIENMENV